MALPSSTRPAYLDSLFREQSDSFNTTPSLRSAHGSVSSTASSADLRTLQQTRPLSPAYEEDDQDDRTSLRSFKVQFSPRRSFRNLLNRRTYPQVQEMVDVQFPASKPSRSNFSLSSDRRPSTRGSSHRPSLSKMQPSLSSPRSLAQLSTVKPLPAAPCARPERELRCQPCYYFAARNCNGYVFGGAHGDACEHCLAAGFFGAS